MTFNIYCSVYYLLTDREKNKSQMSLNWQGVITPIGQLRYSVYPNSTQQKYFTIFKPTLPTIYENNTNFMKYKQKLETIHEVNENYACVKISYV